jgi:hypothetical protein
MNGKNFYTKGKFLSFEVVNNLLILKKCKFVKISLWYILTLWIILKI